MRQNLLHFSFIHLKTALQKLKIEVLNTNVVLFSLTWRNGFNSFTSGLTELLIDIKWLYYCICVSCTGNMNNLFLKVGSDLPCWDKQTQSLSYNVHFTRLKKSLCCRGSVGFPNLIVSHASWGHVVPQRCSKLNSQWFDGFPLMNCFNFGDSITFHLHGGIKT